MICCTCWAITGLWGRIQGRAGPVATTLRPQHTTTRDSKTWAGCSRDSTSEERLNTRSYHHDRAIVGLEKNRGREGKENTLIFYHCAILILPPLCAGGGNSRTHILRRKGKESWRQKKKSARGFSDIIIIIQVHKIRGQ